MSRSVHLLVSTAILGSLWLLSPPTVEAQSDNAWKTPLLQGQQFYQQKHYLAALRQYDQALNLNPNAWEVYLHRAKVYEAQGHHNRAIADYDQAMQMHPKLAQAYLQRSDYFMRRGQGPQALYDLDQGLLRLPYNADLRYTRALFYMQAQRYHEALEDLEMATRVRPSMQAAYLQMAQIHYQQKNWSGYEKALSHLIAQGGKRSEVFLSRAKVRILMKQGEGAYLDLNEVLKQVPHQAEALHLRGQLALARGSQFCEAALKDLRQACQRGRKAACFKRAPCQIPQPDTEVNLASESAGVAAHRPLELTPSAAPASSAQAPAVKP